MRVAFYAPLKSPNAETPSGDRRMGRLLIQALDAGGMEVDLACEFRSRDGHGNPATQRRYRDFGARTATFLVNRYVAGRCPKPDAWFTYHLYYKAADWIGPLVAEALDIPYILAEASHAPKRAGGPWDLGHCQAEFCIGRADAIVGFNRRDRDMVAPVMKPDGRYVTIPPFLDLDDLSMPDREQERDRSIVHLIAVGMMRDGDKLASYRVLADALKLLETGTPWQLTIVGDGPARDDVHRLFEPFPGRISFTGAIDQDELFRRYTSADLLVWPAVNEAYGMALLEAQACGLPVVAGNCGGVPDIVQHGATGLLSPVGDPATLAGNIARLIGDQNERLMMAAAAQDRMTEHHDISSASRRLTELVQDLVNG